MRISSNSPDNAGNLNMRVLSSPRAINSPYAVELMDSYIAARGMSDRQFAEKARTTDRTIRSFRKTGKVRRSILGGIAAAMGISREELLSDERRISGK